MTARMSKETDETLWCGVISGSCKPIKHRIYSGCCGLRLKAAKTQIFSFLPSNTNFDHI